jgi:hypothetical protein
MDEPQRDHIRRLLSGIKNQSGALNWTLAVWNACEQDRVRLAGHLQSNSRSARIFRALLLATQSLVLWAGLTVRLFDEVVDNAGHLQGTKWASDVTSALVNVKLSDGDAVTLASAWETGTVVGAQRALEVVTRHAQVLKERCIALWNSMPPPPLPMPPPPPPPQQNEAEPEGGWTQETVKRTSLYDPSLTEDELEALKRINSLLVQWYDARPYARQVLGGPVFSLSELEARFGSYYARYNGRQLDADKAYSYDKRSRLLDFADPGNSPLGLALVFWNAFHDKTPDPPKGVWTAESVSSRVLYPPYYSQEDLDMLIRINQQRATPPSKQGVTTPSPVKFKPLPPLLTLKELSQAYEDFFNARFSYARGRFMQWARDPKGLAAFLACTKTDRSNKCVDQYAPSRNMPLPQPSSPKRKPRG